MRNERTGWKEQSGGNQKNEGFDPLLTSVSISSHNRKMHNSWDTSQTFENSLEDKFKLEKNGEEFDCSEWGSGRHISERFEDQTDVKYPESQGSQSQYYNYRNSHQSSSWPANNESIGRKPNLFQHSQRFDKGEKKRNLSVDSDTEVESGRFSSKQLKQDIDLRLERTHEESFDFPEDLIGKLLGKKGVTINRIKTLCSPAVITVPTFCNSGGFRVIKIEGYKMQIERSKGVIYQILKERKIEHVVKHFKKYQKTVEEPVVKHEFSKDDLGRRNVDFEAIREKLNCTENEKKDLQKQISKLTNENSGLIDVKNKLQDQVCQLNKEVKDQQETIKTFHVENINCKIKKDFSEASDESWKKVYQEQTGELNFQIETLVNELTKKNYELEEKDLIINDLEQTSEIRWKEVLKLQSEMQRDFVQCDQCEEKFRSNELLRRHTRFKH